MPTRYGTSYFVSRDAAVKYYRMYESDSKQAVSRKLKEGDIHIGQPILKPGQSLIIIDNGARYAIVEPALKAKP